MILPISEANISMTEQCNCFSVTDLVYDEFVHSSCDLVMVYLKIHALYFWLQAKDQNAMNDYSIKTWNWYVKRSSIKKWGTSGDKALLSAPTAQIKAHELSGPLLFIGMLGWMGK